MNHFASRLSAALGAVGMLLGCSDSVPCATQGAVKQRSGVCDCPDGMHTEPTSKSTKLQCVSDDESVAETGDEAAADAGGRGRRDSSVRVDSGRDTGPRIVNGDDGGSEEAGAGVTDAQVACGAGFETSPSGCQDIDECTMATAACHPSASCENTSGGYDCTCAVGFSGGGTDGIACAPRIAVGGAHYCIAMSDDRVMCWGNNESGQLGDGTATSRTTAAYVDGLTNVAAVDTGENFSCALLRDRTVRCWGSNATLQLGQPAVGNRLKPVVVSGLQNVAGLALPKNVLGAGYACALRTDRSVVCWGDNRNGELGNGAVDGDPIAQPSAVLGVGAASALSCSGANCVAGTDGKVRCWGGGSALSYGGTAVEPFAMSGVTSVIAGPVLACSVDSTKRTSCWGSTGLVGGPNAPTTAFYLQPSNPAASVSVGIYHVCTVLESGSLNCWKEGNVNPLLVGDTRNARVASSFSNTTCVLLNDGTARCWNLQSEPQVVAVPSLRAW